MYLLKITDKNNIRRSLLVQLDHLPGSAPGSSQLVTTNEKREVIINFSNASEQNQFLKCGNMDWAVKVVLASSEHWFTRICTCAMYETGWTAYAKVWPKGKPDEARVVKIPHTYPTPDAACKAFWQHWNHDPTWPKDYKGQSVRLIRLNPEWEIVEHWD